jgi:hypothetical protein
MGDVVVVMDTSEDGRSKFDYYPVMGEALLGRRRAGGGQPDVDRSG